MARHKLDRMLDEVRAKQERKKPKEPRGSKVNTSKLTEEDVRGIRVGYRLGFTCEDLSKYYTAYLTHRTGRETRLSRQAVWRIARGKDWKHVKDVEVTPEMAEEFGTAAINGMQLRQ